jgi:hypothetical protein
MRVSRVISAVLAGFFALALSVDSADAITQVTTHAPTANGLDGSIIVDDILSGLNAASRPSRRGPP